MDSLVKMDHLVNKDNLENQTLSGLHEADADGVHKEAADQPDPQVMQVELEVPEETELQDHAVPQENQATPDQLDQWDPLVEMVKMVHVDQLVPQVKEVAREAQETKVQLDTQEQPDQLVTQVKRELMVDQEVQEVQENRDLLVTLEMPDNQEKEVKMDHLDPMPSTVLAQNETSKLNLKAFSRWKSFDVNQEMISTNLFF